MPFQDSITTTALLEDLFIQQDPVAWSAFHQRLNPILRGTARRMGLGEADVEEVVQECLLRVVKSYREGGYVRSGGKLRAWIVAILRNQVRDVQRRKGREMELDTELRDSLVSARPDILAIWDEEAQRQLGIDVLDLLRRNGDFDAGTLKAFEQHVLLGRDAKEVAVELEVGVWTIYKARQRCSARFRQLMKELSACYGFLSD